VVAHRGCHNSAPYHGLSGAPENSLEALDHCVALGADVMETDVRRTRDGVLVMIHDDTVDRVTQGHGRVADMTLAEIQALSLRENEGGAGSKLTDQHVSTLKEMLEHAGNRIVLNLDVKDSIYPEVVDVVVRAGAAERVIVKNIAGTGSAPLAAIAPYDRVPFMPILSSADQAGADLPEVAHRQGAGATKPIGFEVPRMPAAMLPPLAAEARRQGVRLWNNTLWNGFIDGYGGDVDALRDPDAVWGRLIGAGVTMIQTDEPEALLRFIHARGATGK
jgi:glycerophosphoryl diester phosphodiesterase